MQLVSAHVINRALVHHFLQPVKFHTSKVHLQVWQQLDIGMKAIWWWLLLFIYQTIFFLNFVCIGICYYFTRLHSSID